MQTFGRGVTVLGKGHIAWVLFMLGLLFGPVSVHAQEPGGLPPIEKAGAASSMGGQAGMAQLGEDYFVTLAIGTELSFAPVSLGLQLPLRIRVVDNDPTSDNWYRDEDWDEVSDWTRILRYVQYGQPADVFYLRAGELAASVLGHGTILNRYYNNVDIDHYHTGLATNLNMDTWGAQFLVNDLMAWNLVGLRGYVRPLALLMSDANPILNSFKTGVSFVSDFVAPWELQVGADRRPRLDGENNLLYDSKSAWLLGLDLEVDLFTSETVGITPYTDLNFFRDLGVGWHLGVLTALRALSSEFSIRLEYRAMSANYSPAYFNSLYELEKVAFLALPQEGVVPKLRYFTDADLDARQGIYGELYLNILGMIGVGGSYEDYQGPDNAAVMLRADLPKISGIQLAAYYTRRNFDGLGELFSLDQAMAVAQATWEFSTPFYLYGAWSIQWRLDSDPASAGRGEYDSESNFDFGVGVSFNF